MSVCMPEWVDGEEMMLATIALGCCDSLVSA